MKKQALEYQRRRDVLVEGLRRIGWDVECPKATMFVWAKYPQEWRDQMGSIDFSMSRWLRLSSFRDTAIWRSLARISPHRWCSRSPCENVTSSAARTG